MFGECRLSKYVQSYQRMEENVLIIQARTHFNKIPCKVRCVVSGAVEEGL